RCLHTQPALVLHDFHPLQASIQELHGRIHQAETVGGSEYLQNVLTERTDSTLDKLRKFLLERLRALLRCFASGVSFPAGGFEQRQVALLGCLGGPEPSEAANYRLDGLIDHLGSPKATVPPVSASALPNPSELLNLIRAEPSSLGVLATHLAC